MDKKKLTILANALFVLFIILLTLSLFFEVPRTYVEEQLGDNKIATSITYTSVVIITTVFAPFAGLPLSPAVSIIIGPFLTGVLSVIGWTVGAIFAFFIARHLARPLLSHFVDMSKLEQYESYIPEKRIFLWLVFLRVIIPVDILSYAIGFTKRIKFPLYVITTFIGVIPFSFIWSYGGYALLEQNYSLFYTVGGIGLLLFFLSIVYYYVRKKKVNNLL